MNSSKHVRADKWWSASAYVMWIVLWILLAVAMLPFLTGCSSASRAVLVLDPRLTAPVDRPELRGPTNADVWVLAVEQDEALQDCAERLDAIRQLTR
jgi:hypothetical protein